MAASSQIGQEEVAMLRSPRPYDLRSAFLAWPTSAEVRLPGSALPRASASSHAFRSVAGRVSAIVKYSNNLNESNTIISALRVVHAVSLPLPLRLQSAQLSRRTQEHQ